MRKFIKENIVLSLGISLPLLLVVFFIAASEIPRFFIDDPKYDFLFSDQDYSRVNFTISNGKVYAEINPDGYNATLPHLYRYFAATGKVEQVNFVLPEGTLKENRQRDLDINAKIVVPVDPTKLPTKEQARATSEIISEINTADGSITSTQVQIAELANLNMDASIQAPDGYEFLDSNYHGGGGLLSLGFGHSGRNHGPVLSKSGKTIPVSYRKQDRYYTSPNFIGWIIP